MASWSHDGKGRRTSGSAETCEFTYVKMSGSANRLATAECIFVKSFDIELLLMEELEEY